MKAILEQEETRDLVETWGDAEARKIAAEWAKAVLPLYEQARPNDKRPRRAVEAARKYARLCISEETNEAQLEEARYALMWVGHDAAEAAIEAILLDNDAAQYAANAAALVSALNNYAHEAVEAALKAEKAAAKEVK